MSKCKITGKVLAIQLGREETQIVLMGKDSKILHSAVVPTPTGAVDDGMIRNLDAVRDMLKTALKLPEFKRVRQVVFCLSTSQVITETVTAPDLPAAKLEKLLQANVDMYFPVDMQEYQLVWQVIGPKEQESDAKELLVQLWAVPSVMVARYYTVANNCGLSVAAIDYCGHSIATAVGASFARPAKGAKKRKKLDLNMEISFGRKKEAVEPAASAVATETRRAPETDLHLTLDKDLLGMTFVQEGQVVLQRLIRCGSRPSYQIGELSMIVEYFRTLDMGRGSYISGVLSGTLSADMELVAELEDALGIPMTLLKADCAPKWVMCVGAARTTLDFGTPALNRPSKVRKQVQNQIWQYALVLASGLALIAVVMLTLSSRLVWESSIHRLESSRQTLTIQAQTVNGYADNYKKYSSRYDNYSADWNTIFSSLHTNNDNLVLALQELESILPENTSVTNLQITPDGLGIQFACEDKETAAYLIQTLRKLEYMKLDYVSNLTGGGSGPAKDEEGEDSGTTGKAPPTEGSADFYNDGPTDINGLIAAELTEDELMALAMDLTDAEFDLLEQVYGTQPGVTYASLADLKADTEMDVTFEQRAQALREMLTNNPFTANGFVELLEEDFVRDEEAILWWFILDDLLEALPEGAIGGGSNLEDVQTVREYLEILITVLTQDEETLAATERLLCTDENMERWYIYYLEVEMGLRAEQSFPYLNMNVIMEDLLSGGFDTGDTALDAKLNALISEETWALLNKLSSGEGLADMMDKYLTEGTTGEPIVDSLINSYLTNGTTGNTHVDRLIMEQLGGGNLDAVMGDMLNSYLTTGSTGNEALDGMINKYLTDGTTGNYMIDDMIEDYIVNNFTEAQIGTLVDKYLNDGTTGNPLVDSMLDNYLVIGSTGNDKLDAIIRDYMEDGYLDSVIADLVNKYLTDGTTGKTYLDDLINNYLTTGTTGNAQFDSIIGSYIDKGNLNGKMEELVQKYLSEGTTGSAALDAVINKFLTTGTTGNEKFDAIIKDYIDSGAMNDELEALVNKYLSSGTTGNTTLDEMIDRYLKEGTTGNAHLDTLIGKFLEENGSDLSELTQKQIAELLDKYLTTGTTGNGTLDGMINKYLTEGTTGNDKLDDLILDYISSGNLDSMVEKLVNKCLKDGTTGSATLDKLIMNYIEKGTTGNKELDKLIEKYLEEYGGDLGGLTDTQLANMAMKYLSGESTGNKLIDALLKKYDRTGSTGIDSLDKRISKFFSGTGGGTNWGEILGGLLGGLGGNTGGNNNTPAPQPQPVDTRIFFNVALNYTDALKNAEVDREGLDEDAKIEKLEVDAE